MTPLDIIFWAIAAIIAVASLLVVIFIACLIWIVIRSAAKRKPKPKPKPNGDTFIIEGVPVRHAADEIASEMARRRRRGDRS